ncbi:MAG TPA: hypothetical protein VKR30_09950 [Candidatus Limnocylindrales bacterium]|nr:hypothetical protein [Candidatus Limnocylindrales bacterium]
MAIQASTSQSRRAILTAALGAAAASALAGLGRAVPVRAANGDTVTVGGTFTGTAATSIFEYDRRRNGHRRHRYWCELIGCHGKQRHGHRRHWSERERPRRLRIV